MARIRSIKPEFWRDEKIAALKNRLAGFFFIGLWNVADDEGKFRLSAKSLALEMPIFRSKDILTYIRDLSDSGLIQISVCSQWGLVTNWHHQKIDKPRPPKVKREEIQWLPLGTSTIVREPSETIRCKDMIGDGESDREKYREGIGLDLPATPSNSTNLPTAKEKQKPTKEATELNRKVWDSYRSAYFKRYRVEPVRNPAVNSKISQIAKRLGGEAIDVVSFYLTHNDSLYVKSMHAIGLCLAHAEGLRTQWARGKAITSSDVRNFEKRQEFQDLINDIQENGI